MYRNRIVGADGIFIPYILIDLVDGKDSALVLDKQQQDVVLNGGQLHRFPVHGNLFGLIVDDQSSRLIDLGILLSHTAQQGVAAQIGLYPCHQFQRIKGLGYIVIRPDIQSQNLVRVLGLGG